MRRQSNIFERLAAEEAKRGHAAGEVHASPAFLQHMQMAVALALLNKKMTAGEKRRRRQQQRERADSDAENNNNDDDANNNLTDTEDLLPAAAEGDGVDAMPPSVAAGSSTAFDVIRGFLAACEPVACEDIADMPKLILLAMRDRSDLVALGYRVIAMRSMTLLALAHRFADGKTVVDFVALKRDRSEPSQHLKDALARDTDIVRRHRYLVLPAAPPLEFPLCDVDTIVWLGPRQSLEAVKASRLPNRRRGRINMARPRRVSVAEDGRVCMTTWYRNKMFNV